MNNKLYTSECKANISGTALKKWTLVLFEVLLNLKILKWVPLNLITIILSNRSCHHIFKLNTVKIKRLKIHLVDTFNLSMLFLRWDDCTDGVSIVIASFLCSTTNNSYCFELSVSSGNRNTRKILLSCGSSSERRNWAQKFAEHLTCGFPTKFTSEFTRVGWCYLKVGNLFYFLKTWLFDTARAYFAIVHSGLWHSSFLRKLV